MASLVSKELSNAPFRLPSSSCLVPVIIAPAESADSPAPIIELYTSSYNANSNNDKIFSLVLELIDNLKYL